MFSFFLLSSLLLFFPLLPFVFWETRGEEYVLKDCERTLFFCCFPFFPALFVTLWGENKKKKKTPVVGGVVRRYIHHFLERDAFLSETDVARSCVHVNDQREKKRRSREVLQDTKEQFPRIRVWQKKMKARKRKRRTISLSLTTETLADGHDADTEVDRSPTTEERVRSRSSADCARSRRSRLETGFARDANSCGVRVHRIIKRARNLFATA